MSARLLAVVVVVVSCLGASTGAHADELEDFQIARNAYEAQNYALAVTRFERLVGGETPRLSSRPLVLESRKYLAAAYLFMGRREDADTQFERLLRYDETYELDPVAFPTEVLDLFTIVKSRLARERTQTEGARQQADRERERLRVAEQTREQDRLRRLVDLAENETVEESHSRWIAAIPFGVGQFQNGDDSLGVALAISEGLLLAASATAFFIHMSLVDDAIVEGGLPTPERDRAERTEAVARIANWASVGAFLAVAIAGVVDAQIRFEPFERTRRTPSPAPRARATKGPDPQARRRLVAILISSPQISAQAPCEVHPVTPLQTSPDVQPRSVERLQIFRHCPWKQP
jgi:hypothetical protein